MAVHALIAGVWNVRGATADLSGALSDEGPVARVGSGPLRAGAAPMPASPPAPVLLDGYLTNLDDLAPGDGHWTTRLHGLWLREGDEVISALRGAFALLLWDPVRERAVLARDAVGIRAVLLHQMSTRTTFATDLKPLLKLLPRRPAVDELTVARWLAGEEDFGASTLHVGVTRLPPGCLLRFEQSGVTTHRYFTVVRRSPHTGTADELAQELRAQLAAAVVRTTGPPDETAVLLSGGLDSTTIVGVGARAGLRLRTYSAVFPEHPEVDESPWIGDVVRAHSLEHRSLEVRNGSVLRGALTYLLRWQAPTLGTSSFYKDMLLSGPVADGVEVVLDGEGGDELFGVRPYAIADALTAGKVAFAWRLTTAFPAIGPQAPLRLRAKLLLRYGLAGALPAALTRESLPDRHLLSRRWRRAAAVAHATSPWKLRGGSRDLAHTEHLLYGSADGQGVAEHFARLARSGGVMERHPLADQDLVDWVVRLPPQFTFSAGATRPLLRMAMQGTTPASVLERARKSPFDQVRIRSLTGPDLPLVRALLGPDALLGAWLAPGVLERMTHGPTVSLAAPLWSQQAFDLAVLEAWLRFQGDPELPARLLGAEPAPETALAWR